MSSAAPKKPRPSRASGIAGIPTPTTREWARMYATVQRQMPPTMAEKERSRRNGKRRMAGTMMDYRIKKRLNARLAELGLIEPERPPTRIVEVQCRNHKTGPGKDRRCRFRLIYTSEMVAKLEEGQVVQWCCPSCRWLNRTKRRNQCVPKDRSGPPTLEDWKKYEERCKAIVARRQGAAYGYEGPEPTQADPVT